MTGNTLHFDRDYCEDLRLEDGTAVRVRCVRPSDKALFRRGFEQLSPESRYRRFFTAKNELTDAELRYLTECDGVDHFALGAETIDAMGREVPLGVARFVRLDNDGQHAEAAVAVVDHYQGRGIGTLLFQRLIAAARERGITHFRAVVLPDNAAALGLLQELGLSASAEGADDGTVTVDLALPRVDPSATPAEAPRESPIYSVFRAVARGAADVVGAIVPMMSRVQRSQAKKRA